MLQAPARHRSGYDPQRVQLPGLHRVREEESERTNDEGQTERAPLQTAQQPDILAVLQLRSQARRLEPVSEQADLHEV